MKYKKPKPIFKIINMIHVTNQKTNRNNFIAPH